MMVLPLCLVDDELIEQYYNDEEVVLEEGRVVAPKSIYYVSFKSK
jgi:hypothetical protein